MTIDVVRGIAIFLVALGHTNQGVLLRRWWGPLMPEATWMNNFIYAFHMPAFFFVAGVFLLPSLAKRGDRRFTIEKTRTLLYPYVIWLTIGSLSPLLLHGYERLAVPTFREYISWLVTGSFQWFLPTLFFMMLVGMLGSKAGAWPFFAVACVLWVLVTLPAVTGRVEGLAFFYLGLRNLPFLALGMAVGFGFARVEAISRSAALAGCLLCGVVLGWLAETHTLFVGWFLPVGVLGTLMLFLLARALGRGRPARALAWIGEGSLGIFLLSSYFQGGTRAVIAPVVHHNPWAQLLLPSLAAAIVPAWIYNNRVRWKIDWLFVAPWGSAKRAEAGAPGNFQKL